MGVTNTNKTLSESTVACGGSLRVQLALTAEPNITENPADIVLVLDRSGSMDGSALASLKVAAKSFIDIIDEATDGTSDGQIGNGSRIGIVSFADTAVQDTALITSVADLKAAVDALDAGGSTNHADAFESATALFDMQSTNAKVMIMFTDGETTAGPAPAPVAAAAKAQGIIIYSIGLLGNGGIDEAALREWASDPDSAYVAIAPDDSELEELFENLARNITRPGATNVRITDTVSPCFRITSVSAPSKGTASLTDARTVVWEIDELGTDASEGATFEFAVEHVGPCTGTVEVNESILYEDDEDNAVTFPSPSVEVECDIVLTPEPCPAPVELAVEGCSDSIEVDAGELGMQSLGRIVQLDVTLRSVCPGRRVALAVLLNEADDAGNEYKRGMKVITVPAHTAASCRDVVVRCIKFVLPEELDPSGSTAALCNERRLVARFIAHYIDNDFDCCADA